MPTTGRGFPKNTGSRSMIFSELAMPKRRASIAMWAVFSKHSTSRACDRRELLFDNRRDPYQLRNLAEDRANAVTLGHYRELSEQWRKQQNDTFEACTWYRDHWREDRNITSTARGVSQDLKKLLNTIERWVSVW